MQLSDPDLPTETPDVSGAYPRLSEEQLRTLAARGVRRDTAAGQVLVREGDRSQEFFVILAGRVATVEDYGTREEQVLGVHRRGRFLGELGLITGQAAFLTNVMIEPGEVLAVPVGRLRELVTGDAVFGDLVLRAYLIRRAILIGLGTGLRIVGSRFSPDTRRLRDFAARNRLPHRWIDLEEDPDAEVLLREFGITPEQTPVVIWQGTCVLRNPSNADLARVIGLPAPSVADASFDVIVVGAGPAGLAASVYAASEGLSTLTLDAVATGGQAGTSPRIENYLGFPAGVSGGELAERAAIQAAKFGAHLTVPASARAFGHCDGYYEITLDDGSAVSGRTVVIATGARYRKLDVPRLPEFEGKSVYYAATLVEALTCRHDPIAVVGGGNSAGQASLFLARYTARVNLLVRAGDLGKDMSRYLVDQIERNPSVQVLCNTEVRELVGDVALEALVVENNRTGKRRTLPARALFVFIGAAPATGWLGDTLTLDEDGFVLTGPDAVRLLGAGEAAGVEAMEHAAEAADHAADAYDRTAGGSRWRPLPLETSRPGVFAVGDVRSGSVKRVASAVGEGAMAVRMVHERARLA